MVQVDQDFGEEVGFGDFQEKVQQVEVVCGFYQQYGGGEIVLDQYQVGDLVVWVDLFQYQVVGQVEQCIGDEEQFGVEIVDGVVEVQVGVYL